MVAKASPDSSRGWPHYSPLTWGQWWPTGLNCPGTIFREGGVLQVEKEPITLILQTLFNTFIFVGFEEHPSKLRPQMGWSELDLNLDFTLHICIHIHAHSAAVSLIWETGLSCSWDRDQPWHCVPKSLQPYELQPQILGGREKVSKKYLYLCKNKF